MPPLVLQRAKTYQSPYREAEVLLPFMRTGYTAQVAGPAPKRPRVECVTSETGTVMLQGNGYVVPSSFSSIDSNCGKRFSRDDKCLPPHSLFMLRSKVYRHRQVLIFHPPSVPDLSNLAVGAAAYSESSWKKFSSSLDQL